MFQKKFDDVPNETSIYFGDCPATWLVILLHAHIYHIFAHILRPMNFHWKKSYYMSLLNPIKYISWWMLMVKAPLSLHKPSYCDDGYPIGWSQLSMVSSLTCTRHTNVDDIPIQFIGVSRMCFFYRCHVCQIPSAGWWWVMQKSLSRMIYPPVIRDGDMAFVKSSINGGFYLEKSSN